MNAEIVIGTIVDLASSIQWLKSTYFFTRLKKNPTYYGVELTANNIDSLINVYLNTMCVTNLRLLSQINLIDPIDFEDNKPSRIRVRSTRSGQLMARYCLAFETMRSFYELLGGNGERMMEARSLVDLIQLISGSRELEDVKLRTNEKTILNVLNNNGKTVKTDAARKSEGVIRFILDGKVKTHDMKINM